MRLLIGSTFPLSLIRSKVCIEPESVEVLKSVILSANHIYSFWGHNNTLNAVNQLLGYDISPAEKRPALTLNEEKFPVLHGEVFDECWVVSPDYATGFRPEIGVEVKPDQITGWQILKMSWERGGLQ